MMNPVTKAIAGGVVRWLMTVAGTYGITLPVEGLEPFVNGFLILVPLIWSAMQKKATITDAPAAGA